MDTHMRTFFDKMESQFAIPQGTLWEKWSETNNINNPSNEKPKDVKKSNYQVFFSIQRNIITSANSGISFGDVSKQVSSMWKQMTPEEKAKYATDTSTTTTTDKKPSSRKKKVTMTAPAKPIEVDTGSVEIVHTGKKSGRSKLELTADEEKEEDEEDFFFQEDHSRSDEEDVEEDDDEEDVLEEDVDGDMFVDDD
jgi:hypothetical protein